MLDGTEKKECLKILALLSYDNLVSLTDTVTGKVVAVENREGLQLKDYSCVVCRKRLMSLNLNNLVPWLWCILHNEHEH